MGYSNHFWRRLLWSYNTSQATRVESSTYLQQRWKHKQQLNVRFFLYGIYWTWFRRQSPVHLWPVTRTCLWFSIRELKKYFKISKPTKNSWFPMTCMPCHKRTDVTFKNNQTTTLKTFLCNCLILFVNFMGAEVVDQQRV